MFASRTVGTAGRIGDRKAQCSRSFLLIIGSAPMRTGAGCSLSAGAPAAIQALSLSNSSANRILLLKFRRRHLLPGDFFDKEAIIRFSGNDRWAGFASLQQARPSAKVQAAFLLSPTMANEAFGSKNRREDFRARIRSWALQPRHPGARLLRSNAEQCRYRRR